MPPVPNVILASPARTHALTEQRRLLVADERRRSAARPAARVACPTTPDESTTVGSIARGMRSGVERVLVPLGAVAGPQTR